MAWYPLFAYDFIRYCIPHCKNKFVCLASVSLILHICSGRSSLVAWLLLKYQECSQIGLLKDETDLTDSIDFQENLLGSILLMIVTTIELDLSFIPQIIGLLHLTMKHILVLWYQ